MLEASISSVSSPTAILSARLCFLSPTQLDHTARFLQHIAHHGVSRGEQGRPGESPRRSVPFAAGRKRERVYECVCVCVCVCVCMCVCVCVCDCRLSCGMNHIRRERESVCVCGREREREKRDTASAFRLSRVPFFTHSLSHSPSLSLSLSLSRSSAQAPVAWAQREDCVYLTINVADVKDPQLELTKDKLTFKYARRRPRATGRTRALPHGALCCWAR